MRRLLLAEDARRTLLAAAAAAQPHEAGCLLLGVRAQETVWVTSAVAIPGDSGPGHYVLHRGATSHTVNRARAADPRVGYLGDWHSHPDGGGPSATDRATMRALAWFLRRPPPGGPVMVLVRPGLTGRDISAYWTRGPLLRLARVGLTGPLPPPRG